MPNLNLTPALSTGLANASIKSPGYYSVGSLPNKILEYVVAGSISISPGLFCAYKDHSWGSVISLDEVATVSLSDILGVAVRPAQDARPLIRRSTEWSLNAFSTLYKYEVGAKAEIISVCFNTVYVISCATFTPWGGINVATKSDIANQVYAGSLVDDTYPHKISISPIAQYGFRYNTPEIKKGDLVPITVLIK